MKYKRIQTVLGDIFITSNSRAITGLYFVNQRYFSGPAPEWRQAKDDKLLNEAMLTVRDYLAGSQNGFMFPIETHGTEFQEKVWKTLRTIPYGKTITYQHLAYKIDAPTAIRAVSNAVGHNPICIIIPCHRVIGNDGHLRGYIAGLKRKQYLLNIERRWNN